MNETKTLADFAAGIGYGDISDATIHQSKRMIIDQIGCEVGNSGLPWVQQIYNAVTALGSSGPSVVMAIGDRLRPDDAAFVNASFGAANEIDDVHMAVRTHPGAVIVPAVMSVAEATGSPSGTDILLSTIVGYELMIRAAWAAFPSLMEFKHHHTPVACGPFGAAAATAKLLGLDNEGTRNAIAIAGSHSGGLMEYTQSGGSVKRIHTGIASQAGVRSGYFASHGVTGPKAVFEGNRGFLEAFATREFLERLTVDLGSDFMIDGSGLKNYYAMYRIHAPLRAYEKLAAEHGFSFGDVETMRAGVSSVTVQATGTIIEPTDPLGAQFSMRFALACAAKNGAPVLKSLTKSLLEDEETLALARKIEMELDPKFEANKWTSLGASLTVVLKDGREFTAVEDAPLGSPQNPMTDDEIGAKFHSLVDPILGDDRANKILTALWNLEDVDVTNDLLPHVAAPAAAPAASGEPA